MKRNGTSIALGEPRVRFDATSHQTGWLISYADMMTIILTFFILLLSVSVLPQNRFDLLVEALTGRKVGNLREVKERIDKVIQVEGLGGQVETDIDEDGLKIEFSNALLFPSGQSTLTERANQVFEPIGRHLVYDLEPVYGLVIEGYTDDVPISTELYRSNWELSTSRALHVMRRLAESGFNQHRMSVQGFADTRAATEVDLHDPDRTSALTQAELDKTRAVNRRVVIHIDHLSKNILERIAKLERNGASTPHNGIAPKNGGNPNTLAPSESTLAPSESTLAPSESTLAPSKSTLAPSIDGGAPSKKSTLAPSQNATQRSTTAVKKQGLFAPATPKGESP